jgi:riboflavin transporter 2
MMALGDAPSEDQPLKANVTQHGIAPRSRPRQQREERQRAATFAAFVGLGLASWLLTNATYVELGVFLRTLPEQYRIYAYSVRFLVAIQHGV